jgi:hypothetical protein
MSLICNVKKQSHDSTGEWSKAYLDNEGYVESGSAYFAQAFAEALGLISDIELHNPTGARLRLRSMASLLEYALKEYKAAVEFGSATGLNEYHEESLREAGLNFEGVRQVLSEAQSRGFLKGHDEWIEMLPSTFDRTGYSGVMNLYIGRVQEIHKLTVTIDGNEGLGNDGVAWQELGWKLTALFTQTLEVGKAIAILNTLTFRLPEGTLTSDRSHSS